VLAVRSDSFAGVERYLCDVALAVADRGWGVTVIGGDPAAMRRRLVPAVAFRPARTTAQVVRALVSAGPADVVHVHMTAAEVAATVAWPVTRRRFLTTRHFAGPRGESRLGRLAAPAIRRALREQIAISRFVADSIGEPSVVVANGVPDQAQAPLTARRVTMMQRLAPEKDPLTGIRAWARSGLHEQGWRLQVAGRGVLHDGTSALARELRVDDSVDLLGFVEDTGRLLDGTTILLAPATREPFGLSVVEAMSRGVPVVAADGGAHRETVGEPRWLFPPGDAEACAVALRSLAGDAELRRRLGSQLQRRQRSLFSLDVHVDRLEQIYRGLLDQKEGS
jgi:glycosyltransferase involved in cell wall biosynthesis